MIKKLMQIDEYDDAIYFRVACHCCGMEHDVNLSFEQDEDGFLSMRTNNHFIVYEDNWRDYNFFQKMFSTIWWRLKTAMKILFVGMIETRGDFIFDEDNIKAFKEAIRITEEKFPDHLKKKI